jgi:hypothetical protein
VTEALIGQMFLQHRSEFGYTQSGNDQGFDAKNVYLPLPMKRLIRWHRSSMW